jgi:integrase
MVETLSSTSLIGVRDRALLLVGFAGAFRRSEVVSLDVADVTFGGDGLIVQLRRSKTDQEGEGRKVGLPFGSNPLTCPVRALRAWLDVAGIARGPIFRPIDRHANIADTRLTDQSVALIVKRCAKVAGLDWEKYAGHSLRSGRGTRCGRGWPPLRRWRTCRSGRSWPRQGTSHCLWSAATSEMVRSSGGMLPRRLVCDGCPAGSAGPDS